MPTQQETYQLILQLKDEMTAGLKAVKENLEKVKVAGEKTFTGIEGIKNKFKDVFKPIKDFGTILKTVAIPLAVASRLFGAAKKELAEMEAAYVKLYPESQKAAGSLKNWNDVILEHKAAQGQIVAQVLSPIRIAFLNMIEPIRQATWELRQFNAEQGKLSQKYISAATQKAIAIADAQAELERQKAIYSDAQMQAKFLSTQLKAAQANVLKWKPYKGVQGGAQQYQAAQLQVEKIAALIAENEKRIVQALFMIGEIPIWISEQEKGKDAGGDDIEKRKAEIRAWMEAAEAERMGEWNDIIKSIGRGVDMNADALEQRKAEARAIVEAGEAERNEYWNETIKSLEESRDFLREIKEAADEQARIERIRARNEQARGALADPLAAIGEVLNTAMDQAMINPENEGSLLGILAEFFTLAKEGLVGLLSSLVEFMPLILLVMAIMEVIKGIAEILGPVMMNMLQPFIDYLQGIGNVIATLLLPVLQAFEPLLTVFGTLLNGLLPIFTVLVPVFKAIGFVIGAVLIPVMGLIRGVIMFINAVIGSINWLIPGTRWDIPTVPVPEMPSLPKFHEGGTADEDMLAVLKKGEVVLNPYKSRSYIAGGGGGGVTINAPNARYLDKGTAAELVRLGLAGMRA